MSEYSSPLDEEDAPAGDSPRYLARSRSQSATGGDGLDSQRRQTGPSSSESTRGVIQGAGSISDCILPFEKVFPIQIGSEVFRLSGASIGSDAPSYFSQFFEEQLKENGENSAIRTLYIDRDPITFRDIARHLQGYHIKPQDGGHFVKLYADAQFYSLPRLISQLFESEIFIQIGDRHFQIPRDIFSSPGDSPNFFSLGFAVFFSTPGEAFPGLDRRGLLRPPTIVPPSIPNRSGDVFAQLLHLLQGYPLQIRDEEHRQELLRDCRYFHLRGLEQKLIAHKIQFNRLRQHSEITLRLQDIRPSGLSFGTTPETAANGFVFYARPFVDQTAHGLIVDIGDESMTIDPASMRATFHGDSKGRVDGLMQVLGNRLGVRENETQMNPVKVFVGADSDSTLDNEPLAWDSSEPGSQQLEGMPATTRLIPRDSPSPMRTKRAASLSDAPSSKRQKQGGEDNSRRTWVVRRGQWRIGVRIEDTEGRRALNVCFVAVKFEAFTTERARNARRAFLS